LHNNALARGRLVPQVALIPAFGVTMFLSAGLMFVVEPMVAKTVLPRLGGSSAVWSTCLVFFQGMLLLGYAYAHILACVLSRTAQILMHVGLVLPLAALSLPLDLGAGAPSPGASPFLWLLIRLATKAGPAVFAISATAPLLQNWFTKLDHTAASDPYFLYAGSNAGSLLALLAYPLLIEPTLPLDRQALLWSWGFGALALGIVVCATATATARRERLDLCITLERETAAVSLRTRLVWTALAFIPSSLLLGVTTQITADVTSAPLLWVVPLLLYLLTFILTFARRPPFRRAWMIRLMPILLILLVVIAPSGLPLPVLLRLVLHLGCFFVIGMVCHGELAQRRPPSSNLTEFYLFLSLGGVIGGAFNALLAPLIFPDVWEYPLALIAACLVMPTTPADNAGRRQALDVLIPIALLSMLVFAKLALPRVFPPGISWATPISTAVASLPLIVAAMVLLNSSNRRWRFALGVAACFLAAALIGVSGTIATTRSFFGVYRVQVVDDGRFLVLMNGTTLHGVRSLLPGEERLPMAYYSHEGPFGQFFAALAPNSVRHVAVIGLGTGAVGCYAEPGQDWTFYEIDPLVERIARDPRYFKFLADCGNNPRVVLGDARVTIADAKDGAYDVLVIDAFSSDSIPMHLLTREALSLYLRKLAPGGRILFHISSQTLDLAPVIGALAADAGVPAQMLFDLPPLDTAIWRRASAIAVVLTGPGGDLSNRNSTEGGRAPRPVDPRSLWTDQRSDLLRAIRFLF
jgi:hypothetical protein